MDKTPSFVVSSVSPSKQGAAPDTRPAAAPFCRVRATDGTQVLLDPDVAEILEGTKIHRVGKYYGVSLRGVQAYLHHVVAGFPLAGATDQRDGRGNRRGDVHHKNRDRGDNRRENLRALSRAEHQFIEPSRQNAASGFRGVYRGPRRQGWLARIGWQGRAWHNGTFEEPVLAALARDDLARRITRLREGLNFGQALRRKDLRGFLQALGGDEVVTAWFVRRSDGRIRRLVCRPEAGDASALKFDPAARGLLGALDVERQEYRFIPLEGVLCLRWRERGFRVVG